MCSLLKPLINWFGTDKISNIKSLISVACKTYQYSYFLVIIWYMLIRILTKIVHYVKKETNNSINYCVSSIIKIYFDNS